MSNDQASQMLAARLVVLASLTSCIICGRALKCFESTCFSLLSGESIGECNHREISCRSGMESCMTIRATLQTSGRQVIQELRNCSYKAACVLPQVVCNAGNKTGNIRNCQLGCCYEDLCNNRTTLVAKETKPLKRPSGAELSCYSCSSATTGSQPTIQCKNHSIQRCGKSPMTGLVQDRCMTITVKAGSVTQQARNCSDAVYCTGDNYCKSANRSSKGILSQCKVSCCYGNLCNFNDTSGLSLANVPTTSTFTELLFTTDSTRSTNTKDSRVRSGGNVNFFSLESALIVLIVLMLY